MEQADQKRQNERLRSKRKTRCQNLAKDLTKDMGMTVTGKDLSGVDQFLDLYEKGKIRIEVKLIV